jgi:hypothetical protein
MRVEYKRGREDGEKYQKERDEQELAGLRKEIEFDNKLISEFEQTAGIKLNGFYWRDGKELGRAFKLALEGDEAIKRRLKDLERIRDNINETLEEINK